MSVNSKNRFKPSMPCPICSGHSLKPRGKGQRCTGYYSEDREWAMCSREEYSGGLPKAGVSEPPVFAHKLSGDCRCGTAHNYLPDSDIYYDYVDAKGKLLYQVVRKTPKSFVQRRPTATGWEYNLNGVTRVLYRLPELLASQGTVWIVEGEKSVDNLMALGLVATCSSGGAGKWRHEYSEALRGRDVVILPDNDDIGRQHASQVFFSLKGIAASVKILPLPNLRDKEDASDWLGKGNVAAQLVELARRQPEAEIPVDELNSSRASTSESIQLSITGEEVATKGTTNIHIGDIDVCMADVEPEKVEWLVEPYIPANKFVLVEGDPDEGKSFATLAIASAVTTGATLFGKQCPVGSVILLSAEDGRADTIRPRLDGLGADTRRVFAVTVPLMFDEDGFAHLEALILKRQAKLVIVDPIFAYVGSKTDINTDNKVRAITTRLAAIAEKTRCAVVGIRHITKSHGRNAKMAGANSIAWTGSARSVLLFGHEAGDKEKRGFVHTKHNLSAEGAPQGYSITEDSDGKAIFSWTGAFNATADEIITNLSVVTEKSKMEIAKDFLLDILEHGAVPSKVIETKGRQEKISRATLRRARVELGIDSYFDGKAWICALSDVKGTNAANAMINSAESAQVNYANG